MTLHYTVFGKEKYQTNHCPVCKHTGNNWTHFSVIAPRYDVLSIWRVRQGGHVVKVPLLLEDVGLTLPLPHQQLTLTYNHNVPV